MVLPRHGPPAVQSAAGGGPAPGIRSAITSNGAAVWDLGADPMGAVYSRYWNAAEHRTTEPTALIARPMPVELAREAFLPFIWEYPGALSVFCDGRTYRDRVGMARFGVRYARRTGSTEARQPNDGRFTVVNDPQRVDEPPRPRGREVLHVLRYPEEAQAALPASTRWKGPKWCRGAPDNIELTAKGVDKGTALLALADRLGIPREATAAFGDSENDRAMLEKAGIAAVMANGMPQIKALADLVSTGDCDHDGVAELFERLGCDASAFLCNVYKLLCKNIVLVEHYQMPFRRLYQFTNVWWGGGAQMAASPTPMS